MKQVNKTMARKMWNSNTEFLIVPKNMSPMSQFAMKVKPQNFKSGFASFETFLNHYSYYNCNSETGNYPHFYIKGD